MSCPTFYYINIKYFTNYIKHITLAEMCTYFLIKPFRCVHCAMFRKYNTQTKT